MERARLRIAADIGGTFTDIALMLDDGTLLTRKVASTPEDFSLGVVRGIRELAEARGLAMADIGDVLHGCTVATNTILEGKGARTALITTRGFRDVLEFRRIRVPRLYRPLYVKPPPLVPSILMASCEATGPIGKTCVLLLVSSITGLPSAPTTGLPLVSSLGCWYFTASSVLASW